MLSWIGHPETSAKHFLFLDRDGVLNWDRSDYVKNWGEFQFCPDALPALQWLYRNQVAVILISNQSALHRGYMGWDSFWHLHHQMIHHIRQAGGDLLAAFYCPHRPDEQCSCRKPAPGMLESAARLFGVALESAVMIGDRSSDLLAAKNAGCRAVLLNRFLPSADLAGAVTTDMITPDDTFTSLLDAVRALCGAPSS